MAKVKEMFRRYRISRILLRRKIVFSMCCAFRDSGSRQLLWRQYRKLLKGSRPNNLSHGPPLCRKWFASTDRGEATYSRETVNQTKHGNPCIRGRWTWVQPRRSSILSRVSREPSVAKICRVIQRVFRLTSSGSMNPDNTQQKILAPLWNGSVVQTNST